MEAPPQPVNRPPRLVAESAAPARGYVEIAANCPAYRFSIGEVRDDNLDDIIEVRWFLDYSRNASSIAKVTSLRPTGDERRATIDLVIGPEGLNINDDAIHTLEVWVADRKFSTDPLREPANRAFEPEQQEGLTDAWAWTFRRTANGGCNTTQP
ncbi:MAG: hypothetical protein GMKNLPBB_00071 [Myxococcota bacterium]|nr:hypothetical protein [Myxococcota bacterium]